MKRWQSMVLAGCCLFASACGYHRPTKYVDPASTAAPVASSTPAPVGSSTPAPVSTATTATVAELTVTPVGPGPARVASDATEVLALAFVATNVGPADVDLDAVSVHGAGRIDDATDLVTLRLAEDTDGNGRFDRTVDRVLSSGGFTVDDGVARFSVGETLVASDTFRGLIVVDFAGSARSNDELRLILDPADVEVVANAGTVATPGVPFAGPTVRVGGWVTPHQALSLAGDALFPKAVRDANGNTHLAVYQNYNGNSDVWYSLFDGRSYSTADNVSRAPGTAWNHDLAVDGAGLPHLVWEEWDTTINDFAIRFSRFDANSFGWTPAEAVSTTAGLSVSPRLALDANGDVDVVWEKTVGFSTRIMHRHRSASGWSAIAEVSSATGNAQARTPALGHTQSGDLLIVWAENDATRAEVRGRRVGAGGYGSLEIVAATGQYVERPELLRAHGASHVVFVEGGEIFLTRNAGAGWSQPVNVSRSPQAGSLKPALTAHGGEVHVTWIEADPSLPGVANQVAYAQTRGGGLTTPEILTRGPGDRSIPTVVAEGNRIRIYWQDWSLGRQRIFTSWREQGLLEAPRVVTAPGGDPSRPAGAHGALGDTHVVTSLDAGGNHEIFYSREDDPGRGFALAENVSRTPTPSYSPTLATTDDGVWCAWEEDASGFAIRVARRDATGWNSAATVSSGSPAYSPALASGGGTLTLAWTERTATGDHDIHTRSHDGSTWLPAVAVDPNPTSNAWSPTAALSASGTLAVAWEEESPRRTVRVAVRSSAGSSVATVASSVSAQFAPQLAWRGDDLVATWLEDGRVRVAIRPAGANHFDAPVDLSQGGAGSVGVGVTGDVVVVAWEQWQNGDARVLQAVLEAGTWSAPEALDHSDGPTRRVRVLGSATTGAQVLWTEAGRVVMRERREK